VAAGGVLRDIAETAGAVTLSELIRFKDPAEGAASLALRTGDDAGIGFYLDNGRVHVGDLSTVTDAAYRAWSVDRGAGLDSIMLAPTRDLVAVLNARARADRLLAESPAVGREVRLADGNRASAGDTIITRANERRTGHQRLRLGQERRPMDGDQSSPRRRAGRPTPANRPACHLARGLRGRIGPSSGTPPPSTAPRESPPTPATRSPPGMSPGSCSTSR